LWTSGLDNFEFEGISKHATIASEVPSPQQVDYCAAHRPELEQQTLSSGFICAQSRQTFAGDLGTKQRSCCTQRNTWRVPGVPSDRSSARPTCTIQSTPGMSSPRAATSVQNSTPAGICEKSTSAFSRTDCTHTTPLVRTSRIQDFNQKPLCMGSCQRQRHPPSRLQMVSNRPAESLRSPFRV
jgi:hypothetical protein